MTLSLFCLFAILKKKTEHSQKFQQATTELFPISNKTKHISQMIGANSSSKLQESGYLLSSKLAIIQKIGSKHTHTKET